MNLYGIDLQFVRGVVSPLQADTLFGHLCWLVVMKEGEKGLKDFLEPFRGGPPPILLSDGFPCGFLPLPADFVTRAREPLKAKTFRRMEFVTLDAFERIRRREEITPEKYACPVVFGIRAHNAINRFTGTTLPEVGIYVLREAIYRMGATIYLKAVNEDWKSRAVALLEELSLTGYGRRKSVGMGQFKIREVRPVQLPGLPSANGFVSLSSFCPDVKDPTDGHYRVFVKYGKVWSNFRGKAFKKPLVMIRTGSVFRTHGEPKAFYGKMVSNLVPEQPDILHYAYAFTVPYSC